MIKLPESKKQPTPSLQNTVITSCIQNSNNNIPTRADTTVDSNVNSQNQTPSVNLNKKSTEILTLNRHGSSSKLNDMNFSKKNSAKFCDKKAKQSEKSSNFISKHNDGEIILESGEKRSCCKINNCSIF